MYKSVKVCRDVGLDYLLRKNLAPREIQNLALAGAIQRWRKRGIYGTYPTFHPVDKIAQHLVYRRKIEKIKTILLISFF